MCVSDRWTNRQDIFTIKSLLNFIHILTCEYAYKVCAHLVLGAWKEPFPGWTNSKNGPQGFIMGAARGVVRRLPFVKDIIYDYIPVDVVVNHMIVGAKQAAIIRYVKCVRKTETSTMKNV